MQENKVASLLIKLRKQHGFTQSTLADQLGVSFQAVSKWERGENLPDAFTMVELARIYDITVDEILRGEVIKKELSTKKDKRKGLIIGSAVAMIIIAPVSIFVFGTENWEYFVPSILIIIAISVMAIIYASMSSESNNKTPKKTAEEKKQEDIIYGICAGIFMVLGLVFNLFHIAWIVFIFGYVAVLIVKK